MDMIIVSKRFDNAMCGERGIGKVFDAICNYYVDNVKGGKPRAPQAVLLNDDDNNNLVVLNNAAPLDLFDQLLADILATLEPDSLDMEDAEVYEVLTNFVIHVMKKAYYKKQLASVAAPGSVSQVGDNEE